MCLRTTASGYERSSIISHSVFVEELHTLFATEAAHAGIRFLAASLWESDNSPGRAARRWSRPVRLISQLDEQQQSREAREQPSPRTVFVSAARS
jgi:hypothetical protein